MPYAISRNQSKRLAGSARFGLMYIKIYFINLCGVKDMLICLLIVSESPQKTKKPMLRHRLLIIMQ